jgi:ribonuclease HI
MEQNENPTILHDVSDELLRDEGGRNEAFTYLTSSQLSQVRAPDDNLLKVDVTDPRAQWITESKVTEVFKSFGSFKAAGPDGIRPICLKNLGPHATTRITNIYKVSYLLGVVPKPWLQTKVIFLPKPLKPSYTNPKAFRPISLMDFLFKGMEKLFLWEFNNTVLKDKPLHDDQHGFRHGRSCDSALTSYIQPVEAALNKKDYVMTSFCDVVGAFDQISYPAIMTALKVRGFDPLFISWYSYYLNSRVVTVNHKGIKVARKCVTGVPQGSCLSPTAFSLATEPVLKLFSGGTAIDLKDDPHPKVSLMPSQTAFADDLQFSIHGKNLIVLQEKMQWILNKLQLWAATVGLQFSSSKTAIVIFSRKRRFTKPNQCTIGGQLVSYADHARYLGVFVDRRLNWRYHVNLKIKLAKKTLMSIVSVCGQTWGLTPQAAAYYYKCIVKPKLTFGALVWHQVCRFKGIQNNLKRLQRLALTHCGPLRRSTPTHGLEITNYMRPLELEVRKIAAEAFLRTKNYEVIPPTVLYSTVVSHKGHRQWCQEFITTLDLDRMFDNPTDASEPRQFWDNRFHIDYKSMERPTGDRQTHKFGAPRFDTKFNLFSDGSLTEGIAGTGIYICDGFVKDSYRLGPNISVWQAETYGVKRCAQWIVKNPEEVKDQLCVIYVDSQACIKSLGSKCVRSRLTIKTIHLLNAAARKCRRLIIRWVRSHQEGPEFAGNRQADQLANTASKDHTLAIVNDAPKPSVSTIKHTIRDRVDHYWSYMWKELDSCRQTKLFFPEVDRGRSYHLLLQPRYTWGRLVQFLSGHAFLRRHDFLCFGATDESYDPMCNLCDFNELQTPEHIISVCPYFLGLRSEVFGVFIMDPPYLLPISKVLKFLSLSGLEAFCLERQGQNTTT